MNTKTTFPEDFFFCLKKVSLKMDIYYKTLNGKPLTYREN